MTLFNRKKQKAIAFIDYEYWYYSCKTRFNTVPDPAEWLIEMQNEYDVTEVMVFGDFSNQSLSDELVKVRSITNSIIETGNTYHKNKKDMTDFIMLDYVYQAVDENKKAKTYILFTGDGHFQSVVKYIAQKKKKNVVICGIADSMSRQLHAVASKVMLYPSEKVMFKKYAGMIARNMQYVEKKPNIIPTFWGTVDAVVRKNHVLQEPITEALKQMLDKGYIVRQERVLDDGKTVMILAANWEALTKAGLWFA